MSIEGEGEPASVDGQAAAWIVAQDGEGLSAEAQRAFDLWVADPSHREAYERQAATWRRYRLVGSALSTASPRERRHAERHAGSARPARPARRRVVAAAIAASLALLVVGHIQNWPMRLRADYVTDVGERRAVTLADGSRAVMDGGSALAFRQSDGLRQVRLMKGSAVFQVAPDRAHPFVVETDAGSVTALGTAFAVRLNDGEADLVVTEHKVRARTRQGASAIVQEGQAARFRPDSLSPPHAIDANAATAWTRGKLIVTDEALGDVVAAIGAQRRGYWTVTGDAAAIRVNGVYDLDHPLAALDMLEKSLNLRSFRLSDRLILLSR